MDTTKKSAELSSVKVASREQAAEQAILRLFSCLPGLLGFFTMYYFVHTHEWHEKKVMLTYAFFFALCVIALLYQRRHRIRRWERPFRLLNWGFALFVAPALLMYIFNIDFMPRQA
jgi:phosphatidylserine synthase